MIGQFVVRDFLYRPNCQEQNYHFAALNLKVKERRLSTLRNWMLTLSFNILSCVYLWRKMMMKLNCNLIKEEDSCQCLKVLSQETVKKTKTNWQIFEKKQEKQAIPSTNNIKKHPCKHTCSWSFAKFFQRAKKERWKQLQARHNVHFQKTSSVTLMTEYYIECS